MKDTDLYDCWTEVGKPHPWEDEKDMPCGYEERGKDVHCLSCWRQTESKDEKNVIGN